MSKKKKKISIPKNKDIEELVAKEKNKIAKLFKREKKKNKKLNKANSNNSKLSKDSNLIALNVNEDKKIPAIVVDNKEEKNKDVKAISKKAINFNLRREAKERAEKRDRDLAKAVSNLEKIQKSDEYKEEQEFFAFINENKEVRRKELQDENMRLDYGKMFREKYAVNLSAGSKNKKKNRKEKTRCAGTSMGEILNSKEFKKMWNSHDEI